MSGRQKALSHNLPLQLTRFIGREREIKAIKQLLTGDDLTSVPFSTDGPETPARLVTLTGVGGCGKTRLALEVAAALCRGETAARLFTDGIWFVEFAPLSNPARVVQVVAATLNLRENAHLTPAETLAQALHTKKLLLLFDNCEHLPEACAQLVETLLQACPDIFILTTSRASLNLPGEVIFPVTSLEILNPNDQLPTTNLVQCESVRLFIDRATAVQPHFTLTDAQVRAVTQICRQLDGIPLAIELAATRIKMLTPQQIVRRLDDVFRLLRSTGQTLIDRHQNLHAAFDWSYALLTEPQRTVFRRLSVFAGGWTLGAAEEITGFMPFSPRKIFNLHERLLDQSLITRVDDGQGERARYRMLEPLRQFATEKLTESAENRQVRDRHLEYFMRLAEEAEPAMLGPDQAVWFVRLDAELPNIRAALDWSIDAQALERSLRLTGALWPFWEMRSYLTEGRYWLEQLLERASSLEMETPQSLTRMKAIFASGVLCWLQGRYDEARQQFETTIAMTQVIGAEWFYAYGLCRLGRVFRAQGEPDKAQRCFETSLKLFRQLDDAWGISRPLRDLGLLSSDDGRFAEARAYLREVLTLRYAIRDPEVGDALDIMGQIERLDGNFNVAETHYHEAIGYYQAIGYRQGIAAIHKHLGYIALKRGNLVQAEQYFKQSLLVSYEIGTAYDAVDALVGLQTLAVAQGDVGHGAHLEGFLETLTRRWKRLISQEYRPLHDQALKTISAALGKNTFAALKAQGCTMAFEQVAAYVFRQSSNPVDLTQREVEVLRLVAEGLTNQQIADRLVISRRTVHAHLRSIFSKLDVNTRTAAAREASRLKLV